MRSVPTPDLRGLNDDQVWERLHYGMVDSDEHKQCVLMLQLRNLDRQTKASSALVTATEALVDATKTLVTVTGRVATFTARLVSATWALVGVSLLLLVATALQVVRR